METVEFLGNVDLFKHLDTDAKERLAARLRSIYLPDGHIIRDTDPVDGLYIIESGMVKVTKTAERWEAEAVLAILRPGNCFGEIGLIDGQARTANVVTMEPTRCLFLPRDAFFNTLEESPKIAVAMLPALASMVRNADEWIARLM